MGNFLSSSSPCTSLSNTNITFYGYVSVNPPSGATAWTCPGRSGTAGGERASSFSSSSSPRQSLVSSQAKRLAWANSGDVYAGIGTYTDPVTFATPKDDFEACEIIYVPYLEKYLIAEDERGTPGSFRLLFSALLLFLQIDFQLHYSLELGYRQLNQRSLKFQKQVPTKQTPPSPSGRARPPSAAAKRRRGVSGRWRRIRYRRF